MMQAASRVMTRDAMEAMLAKVRKLSQAERVALALESRWTANTRFAANQMSTAGAIENTSLSIESGFGNRHASVDTNDLSERAIEAAVRRSEHLARIAPPDPEVMPPLGPQTYRATPAHFEATANVTPEARAKAALTALDAARRAGDIEAAGYLVVAATASARMNSAGLFAYHRQTSANYTLTARTKDGTGSGFAGADHNDWTRLDFTRVAERAIEKARASRQPVAIEAGRYTVILEPQACADLCRLLAGALSARNADEGRSPFTRPGGGNRVGEQIVDPRVTVLSDPHDPDLLDRPFDNEGLPLARQVWVENGVLKQLVYSRFWGAKQGVAPTGGPSTFKIPGGPTTREEMIRTTARGVLVTRLWYLRQVDPRTVLYTGLTRDGTFLIENGEITKSIKNFRFNDSPLFILNQLEALGPAERVAGSEGGGGDVVPIVKVRDFTFTSQSDAV
jgi:predicted Zn-dependent protease